MILSKISDTVFGGSVLSPPGNGTILCIHPNYGLVVYTLVGSIFMVTWKAMQVGKARKEYKINYPTMYSPDNNHFNCIQRGHQNTLELYPTFMSLLLLGGYSTGEPKNRMRGAYSYIGLIMLLMATTKFGIRLLSQR
ncbi:unnamed protein product [Allacma fusca]|uniref:Uncharacterized protein n=1 Tax=Allacma fusca TaxID=39272 RepID=A0A8J2LNP2_9HEXA|nr:unnamed protein product [Allacma fusca]